MNCFCWRAKREMGDGARRSAGGVGQGRRPTAISWTTREHQVYNALHPGQRVLAMDYSEYVAHLNRYPSFSSGGSDLPQFTYASEDDASLRRLREQYGLAQVAGDGDGLSRALRILQWVYGELGHHGEQVAVEPRDAINIIETCRRTRCAVWCFDKAVVLTDALLSE